MVSDETWDLIVIDAALQKIARLERLILWLAKAYGDNNPQWNYQNLRGHDLSENRELAATWYRVVRNTEPPQL